ncbi:hypothetical protein H7J87_11735 [Mycolicibacterium wolinskyi]|uniref:Uncharacterized protein n=1 Tax=Mycolicibacterium wolinskyi TaxID=59750 RepID=A0A1X2FJC9_9MYCO|nr:MULTISPECIES: hypothetical protein [Mycolicibacterium]MCV7286001.1 hypothetical protein [Mycolicibacterium wolinskyi]MCV7296197.1 hypothetical protein [Mycolicibacterium goodii]ORX18428.1 hypothetical protein AWC31_14085 [Mycolicibacterium wolinskyi]
MIDVELTPTRRWQALVPELQSMTTPTGSTAPVPSPAAADRAADTAERLLLLLHYSIDWDNTWIGEEKHRKTYWDDVLVSRVRVASYRSATLHEWWSTASSLLDATAPRHSDRRRELAQLLQEPPLPVLSILQTSLPALLLRVRIITEAVSAERKAQNR